MELTSGDVDVTAGVELVVTALELISVTILAVGVAFVLGRAGYRALRGSGWEQVHDGTRRSLGRVLLLGLEVLIAADIIKTVAVELTLANAGALGLIVIIRTFLSWAIEVETEGRWPWQARHREAGAGPT